MINPYGHVLRVRDPATGAYASVPAIRGEKGPSGGPLDIRYAWDASTTNEEYTDTWVDGQRFIGMALYESDEMLATYNKSSYKWLELPVGPAGQDGKDGDKGDKGDKGDADRIRFAYAYRPTRQDLVLPDGSVETSTNDEYSLTWATGMSWLGVYSGTDEPSKKIDYTWIQLPKGESGDGPVRIKYATKHIDKIATSREAYRVIKYTPSESYYYIDYLNAKTITQNKIDDGTYTKLSWDLSEGDHIWGFTLREDYPIYNLKDNEASSNLKAAFDGTKYYEVIDKAVTPNYVIDDESYDWITDDNIGLNGGILDYTLFSVSDPLDRIYKRDDVYYRYKKDHGYKIQKVVNCIEPKDVVFYAITNSKLDALPTNFMQVAIATVTGEGPVYSYTDYYNQHEDSGIDGSYVNSRPVYLAFKEGIGEYARMEIHDTYNPNVDFMGIYIGSKNENELTNDDYQWMKIKGSTGRTGGPVFIRYATGTKDGSVAVVHKDSITPTWNDQCDYIGIGVGEPYLADEYGSCNNSDDSIYNWIPLFRGVKGDKGDKGDAGKPSALLFKYAPGTNLHDMSDYRRPTDTHVGICKTAYYDPYYNTSVTDDSSSDNFLWLELPDTSTMEGFKDSITTLSDRTMVSVSPTEQRPVNEVVSELYTEVMDKSDLSDTILQNIESYRLASSKADHDNVDKLNTAIAYMRKLLERIRTLEVEHSISASGDDLVNIPFFPYSNVETDLPINVSFTATCVKEADGQYTTWYMSNMVTSDTSVWVKLAHNYGEVFSTGLGDKKLHCVHASNTQTEELYSNTWADTHGYCWFLMLKGKDTRTEPFAATVPDNIFDYILIEKNDPTGT